MYKYCCFFWLSNEVGDLLLILRFQFFGFWGQFCGYIDVCVFSRFLFRISHFSGSSSTSGSMAFILHLKFGYHRNVVLSSSSQHSTNTKKNTDRFLPLLGSLYFTL